MFVAAVTPAGGFGVGTTSLNRTDNQNKHFDGYEHNMIRAYPDMVDNGEVGVVVWRCNRHRSLGCRGRLRTNSEFGNERMSIPHTCPRRNGMVGTKSGMRVMEGMAATSQKSIQRIFNEVDVAMSLEDRQFCLNLPSMEASRRRLQRVRAAARNAQPAVEDLFHLDLDQLMRNVFLDPNLVIYDAQPDANRPHDRPLVLATPETLDLLENNGDWYADGTFVLVPRLWYQLYSIHVRIDDVFYLCVIALLNRKSQRAYEEMMGALVRERPALANVNCPRAILTDFESPAHNAFGQAFPMASLSFCFFHLTESVRRRVNALGLTVPYRHNVHFALLCRMLPALAFVPTRYVRRAFDAIVATGRFVRAMANRPGFAELVAYFERTYIGTVNNQGVQVPPRYPIRCWNMHLRTRFFSPRTNNAVEGFHRGFSSRMALTPQLDVFLESAYLELSESSLESFRQAVDPLRSRPRRRDRRYIDLDDETARRTRDFHPQQNHYRFVRSLAHLFNMGV